jgi:hypothetical protein
LLKVPLITAHHIILALDDLNEAQKLHAVQALIWICEAVRLPPSKAPRHQMYLSTAYGIGEAREVFTPPQRVAWFSLKPLEPFIVEENNCWVGLFEVGIVAKHHIGRSWGLGLEIPFDMMVHLTAVESYSWVKDESSGSESTDEGGFILIGFYTALIPTQRNKNENGTQWHLEYSKDRILHPSSLQTIQAGWSKISDIKVFEQSKCFIGWCGKANIMLGTRELSYNLRWSGLPTRSQTLHKKGGTATAQIAGTGGPIQIAFQAAQSYEYVTNQQHFQASAEYATAITELSRQVALVYDSETKQAWLVPKLSLLLHLCHTWFKYYKKRNSQADDPVPFADPSPDGAAAAEEAFDGKGDTVVLDRGPKDKVFLRGVLVDINNRVTESVTTREMPKGATLFGSELMDLLSKPGTGSKLPETKTLPPAEAWLKLVEFADAVLVCSKLGQALQPVPEVPLPLNPCDCVQLPTNRCYLAAHLWCLEIMLDRQKLSIKDLQTKVLEIKKNWVWCLNGEPFHQCQHTLNNSYWAHSENVLQKLSEQGIFHSKVTATPSVYPMPLQGAVVFGIPPPNLLQKRKSSGS